MRNGGGRFQTLSKASDGGVVKPSRQVATLGVFKSRVINQMGPLFISMHLRGRERMAKGEQKGETEIIPLIPRELWGV